MHSWTYRHAMWDWQQTVGGDAAFFETKLVIHADLLENTIILHSQRLSILALQDMCYECKSHRSFKWLLLMLLLYRALFQCVCAVHNFESPWFCLLFLNATGIAEIMYSDRLHLRLTGYVKIYCKFEILHPLHFYNWSFSSSGLGLSSSYAAGVCILLA